MPTAASLRFSLAAIFALIVLVAGQPAIAAPSAEVQVAWRLLDYIAVDYKEAITNGKIVNAAEYAEMTEFSRAASARIKGLPERNGKAGLLRQAEALQAAIERKEGADVIAGMARNLAQRLIVIYPVPLVPPTPPSFEVGRSLYVKTCASCHGVEGNGKGPAAAGLEPSPIAFNDYARARERSIFGLYQVIEQGIDGTSMPSFAHLSTEERWSLAFYVGAFAYQDKLEGERIWNSDSKLRSQITMEQVVSVTPAALADVTGKDKSDAVVAYLRHNPAAVIPTSDAPLALSRARLKEAVSAYTNGDRKAASDLALSAYLDGFEPVEAVLATHDKALMIQIEEAMGRLRSSISEGAPPEEVRQNAEALESLFSAAEEALSPDRASSGSSFVGAFTILLREGLEALLIVLAMITFLRRADRQDVLRYVHWGWVAALGAGGVTWALATFAIKISGASRELTEGFGSLFASLVLLWVGIWMHGKSNADVWQRYIREKLNHALNKNSAWFLFGLSFIVVYREVFETILFYAAIWSRGNGLAVIGGALSACVVLGVIGWAMVKYSRTLPIGKFFAYSSALISILSVVLIGKAVSALQEAGYVPSHVVSGLPRIEILGVYPTIEGIASQILVVVIIAIGFTYSNKSQSPDDSKAR